jgi:4-amino-4-deoxy-L-arabinose transferase-like glycosyltransferase
MKPSRPDTGALIVAAIALGALALRAYGLDWGLPQVYEEATPLRKAWEMWGFGPIAPFDLNPHFFKYPSLTIYIQFLGIGILYLVLKVIGLVTSTADFRVLYIVDPTPFLLLGRTLSALMGAATVWLVFVFGRRAAGTAVGAAAAFFLAVNPFHIAKCQVVEVDVPLTLFTLLALWGTVRWMDTGRIVHAVLTGVAIGLAASSKYTGAFLVVPVIAVFALGWRRRPPEEAADAMRGFWVPLLVAGASAALVFVLTSPYVLLDAGAFWRDIQSEREHMELGHFGATSMSTPEFYLLSLGRRLLGWPLLVLAAAGLVRYAAVLRRTWALPLGIFVVVYVAIVSMWSMKVDRYLLPMVPPAMILGTVLLRDLLARGLARARPVLVPAVLAVTAAAVAVPTAVTWPHLVGERRADPRTRALKWIEATIPSGAYILTEYHGPEFLDVHHLWTLEGDLRRRVSDGARPVYAVQTLPMYQVGPERSSVFYNLGLYDMVDVFLITGSVSGRYLKDPVRFPAQAAFYRHLEQDFQKLAEFKRKGDVLPAVTVYKRYAVTPVFGGRTDVPGPRPLAPTEKPIGEESVFYYSMGLNYEAFGFFDDALECYGMGLGYPMKLGLVVDLSTGAARCLLRLGRKDEAIQLLDTAAAKATRAEDRAILRGYRERLGP